MAGLDDETQANQELADELNMDEADWERLRQDINSADSAEPRCGAPDVRELPATVSTLPGGSGETVAFWHEEGAVDEDGRPRVWRLTEGQRVAYERLKVAGSKQLLTFLSGEGGMGKSLLVCARALHSPAPDRSQHGSLACADSPSGQSLAVRRAQCPRMRCECKGSAPHRRPHRSLCVQVAVKRRLLRDPARWRQEAHGALGMAVHARCAPPPPLSLRYPSRSPTVSPTTPSPTTTSMPLPASPPLAQVIVIDEVSMLTAGALHGVNHALNHVMSFTTSAESTRHFGSKSVLAVGDLFQLPAVEKHRFKEQVRGYQSRLHLRHTVQSTCKGLGLGIPRTALHAHARRVHYGRCTSRHCGRPSAS